MPHGEPQVLHHVGSLARGSDPRGEKPDYTAHGGAIFPGISRNFPATGRKSGETGSILLPAPLAADRYSPVKLPWPGECNNQDVTDGRSLGIERRNRRHTMKNPSVIEKDGVAAIAQSELSK